MSWLLKLCCLMLYFRLQELNLISVILSENLTCSSNSSVDYMGTLCNPPKILSQLYHPSNGNNATYHFYCAPKNNAYIHVDK